MEYSVRLIASRARSQLSQLLVVIASRPSVLVMLWYFLSRTLYVEYLVAPERAQNYPVLRGIFAEC